MDYGHCGANQRVIARSGNVTNHSLFTFVTNTITRDARIERAQPFVYPRKARCCRRNRPLLNQT